MQHSLRIYALKCTFLTWKVRIALLLEITFTGLHQLMASTHSGFLHVLLAMVKSILLNLIDHDIGRHVLSQMGLNTHVLDGMYLNMCACCLYQDSASLHV